MMCHS